MSDVKKQLEQLEEQIQSKEKYISERKEALSNQLESTKRVNQLVGKQYSKRLLWYVVTRLIFSAIIFVITILFEIGFINAAAIALVVSLFVIYFDLYFKAKSWNPGAYFADYKSNLRDKIFREHKYELGYEELLREKIAKAEEDISRFQNQITELKAKHEADKKEIEAQKAKAEQKKKAAEEAKKSIKAKTVKDAFADIRNDDFVMKNIKKLFTNAFKNEEIDLLCKDYFPEVFKDFTKDKKPKDKIRELTQYTKTYSKTGELLSIAKASKPEAFDENKPYYKEKAGEHKENVFVKWDENQDDDQAPMPEYGYYEFIKHAHQIKPREFFGFRATLNFKNDFYFRRDFDTQIEENIREKQSFIVVGDELSGKTRALWEALKHAKNAEIIKPNILKLEDEIEKLPQKKNPFIAVFDDIEFFYQTNEAKTSELIDYLIKNEACIIASISSEAWKTLKQQFNEKYNELVHVIEIPQSETLLDDFKSQVSKKANAKYDQIFFEGQIGSLFLNMSRIQNRYLQDIKTKQLVARELLQAVKSFWFFGNYTRKNLFNLVHIKDFCNRRMSQDIKVFKRLPEQDWREALQILSVNIYKLNFVERFGAYIFVENAFIRNIIQPEMTLRDAVELIYRAFPEQEERQKLGFNLKTSMFNTEIDRLEEFDKAFEVYDYMNDVRIDPDNTTFQLLLRKAPADKIQLIYNDITEYEITPTEETLNLMLEKSANIEEASELLDKMHELHYSPYEDVILDLHRHAKDKKDALLLLNIFEQYAIKPNPKIGVGLIRKTKTYAEASELITELTKNQIEIDQKAAEILIEKIEDIKDRDKYFNFLNDYKIKANDKIASQLLKKEKHFEPSKLMLESLMESNADISSATFDLLAQKIKTLDQAGEFIPLIAKYGHKPGDVFFKHTGNLIKTAGQGMELMTILSKHNFMVNKNFTKTMSNKAKNFTEAIELVKFLKENKLEADEQSVFTLGQKVDNFDEAISYLKLLNEKGMRPDLRAITSMIPKTESYKQAKAIYKEINILGLTPDSFVFNTLMMRTDNLNEVIWIMNEMLEHDVKPDKHTKKRLEKKAEIVEKRAPEHAQKLRDIANTIK